MSTIMQQVLMVQSVFMPMILRLPNVVGVAVGYKESGGVKTDELALVALVEQKKPLSALSASEAVPREFEGVRTDVYEVGKLVAQQTPRERYRPVMPSGISIGHYKVTAGTLGTIVTDRSSGERLILSNNHVLANSNDANVGDAILQPGSVDGGQNPADVVARLLRFVPLQYLEDPAPTPPPTTPPPPTMPPPTTPAPPSCDVVEVIAGILNAVATLLGSSKRVETTTKSGSQTAPTTSAAQNVAAASMDNLVDAALAKPVNASAFTGEILGIGHVSGTKPPALGMRVRKSGRTTGYTEGTITLLNATVNVSYSTARGARTGRFTGQIITEAMSQGGDSGSLIVDKNENRAVGLLFAGSSVATIFTPIDRVLDALNVNI